MSTYAKTPPPPRSAEVVKWAKDRLAADSSLSASGALGSANVYRTRPSDAPDRLLVVRERQDLGGRRQHLAKLDNPVIQVMSECTQDLFADEDKIFGWHDYIQDDLVFASLANERPALSHGIAEGAVKRITVPGEAAYDAQKETYYATSEYSLVIGPK